jgi:hypothetical protein
LKNIGFISIQAIEFHPEVVKVRSATHIIRCVQFPVVKIADAKACCFRGA